MIPTLTYLDERPVFEIERLKADAWIRGGAEEEERVREEYARKKLNQTREFIKFG